jgi:DNA-binding transcriptional LysR family regulator
MAIAVMRGLCITLSAMLEQFRSFVAVIKKQRLRRAAVWILQSAISRQMQALERAESGGARHFWSLSDRGRFFVEWAKRGQPFHIDIAGEPRVQRP